MDIPEEQEFVERTTEEQVEIVMSLQEWLFDALGPKGTVIDLLLITRTLIAKMRTALYHDEVHEVLAESLDIVEREMAKRKDELGLILAEDWRGIEGGVHIANAIHQEIPDTVPEDLLDDPL